MMALRSREARVAEQGVRERGAGVVWGQRCHQVLAPFLPGSLDRPGNKSVTSVQQAPVSDEHVGNFLGWRSGGMVC